ncbi:MAG: ammonia-forming cytochrome c nitrite reductase subunit c552, partial [Flavobacteriales bacterium]
MNKTTRNWLIFFATVLIAFFVGWLGSNITEKNTEARFAGGSKAEIGDMDTRNEVWGKNYPKQFETYYETADTAFASKYNGSHTIDELEEDPMLVMLWAGYGFSKG